MTDTYSIGFKLKGGTIQRVAAGPIGESKPYTDRAQAQASADDRNTRAAAAGITVGEYVVIPGLTYGKGE